MKARRSVRSIGWGIVVGSVVIVALGTGSASAQVPLPDPLRVAGEAVLDALKANDLTAIEGRFDERMKGALPHDQVVAMSERLHKQLGGLTACDAPTAYARDGQTVVSYSCDFAARPMGVMLTWSARGELGALRFAPVPAPVAATDALPVGVREESLQVGAPGWPLPASLLLPARERPPVALLVSGSGPNDRDESVAANRPFRDLAVGLAERGVATLRYDKRTRAFGARFVAELKDWTIDDEIVDDAVAALVRLSRRPDVGPIFVIGHSEGALFAPRVAERAAAQGVRVAGLVMLAAPLTPLADLFVDQYAFLAKQPQSGVTLQMVADLEVRRDHVAALARQSAGGPIDASARGLSLPFDMPASAWRDIATYDPAATLLAEPAVPALLVFGGRDYQVRVEEEALWASRVGRRPDTTLVDFPALNHILIEGTGPPGPSEYGRPGQVSPALIDRVGRWIGDRTPAKVAMPRGRAVRDDS